MKLKDYLQTIIALAAVIALVLGALSYFATAQDLQLVEMRLDQKIVTDQMLDLKRQKWQLEDRNREKGPNCINWEPKERDEYRRLQDQLEQLQERAKKLSR